MVRVKEGHVVEQVIVDEVNAVVERVLQEIKGVVEGVDRRGVAPNGFAVAASVDDAFIKNGARVGSSQVGAKEEGSDDGNERGDGEKAPAFTRGRGGVREVRGGGGRRGGGGVRDDEEVRAFAYGRGESGGVGRRRVLNVVGGGFGRRRGGRGFVVAPKGEAFYFEHRRNAKEFAAFAGEGLAGLRRFDRRRTLAARTGQLVTNRHNVLRGAADLKRKGEVAAVE